MSLRLLPLLLFTITIFISCAKQVDSVAVESTQATLHTAVIQVGDHEVTVECAVTQDQKARGLMYRKSLAENSGMLFYFDKPQPVGFWMKNTLIPLSIAYLDEKGEILEIYPLTPLDETPTTSRSYRVKYALEMNQGWFKKNGVKPGDRVYPIPEFELD